MKAATWLSESERWPWEWTAEKTLGWALEWSQRLAERIMRWRQSARRWRLSYAGWCRSGVGPARRPCQGCWDRQCRACVQERAIVWRSRSNSEQMQTLELREPSQSLAFMSKMKAWCRVPGPDGTTEAFWSEQQHLFNQTTWDDAQPQRWQRRADSIFW